MPTVEAKVAAASCAYFTSTPLLDAKGDPRKKSNGDKIYVDVRNEAVRGEKIKLSEFEFHRLEAEGIVVSASEELRPLGQSLPTPFSTPVKVGDDDEPSLFPAGAIAAAAGGLSPELAASLNAKADGEGIDDTEFSIDEASDEELVSYVDRTNIEDVITMLKNETEDGSIDAGDAQRVIEAETARERPRPTLIDQLQKVVDEQE